MDNKYPSPLEALLTPRREPDKDLDQLAHAVIGAPIEVHRELGPGHREPIYDRALAIELTFRCISFHSQYPVVVTYKGKPVGRSKLDFLVGNSLVVEVKAVEALAPIHSAQAISYLKLTGKQLALLINFNVPVLKSGLKRIVLSN